MIFRLFAFLFFARNRVDNVDDYFRAIACPLVCDFVEVGGACFVGVVADDFKAQRRHSVFVCDNANSRAFHISDFGVKIRNKFIFNFA